MKCYFMLCVHFFLLNGVWTWELWEKGKDLVFGETCSHRWIPQNVQGLTDDFKYKIFGQPFIVDALIPLLKRHFGVGMQDDYSPRKALVLSFHGSPGVGKTFVTQLIAKHLFKAGDKSLYYKYFSLGNIWSVNEKELRETVINTIRACERAVFVFDEVEKMDDGILEVIKSFLDFHSHIENVDYRKSTFIFISNIGMDRINSLALTQWKKGLDRKEYKLVDFENALRESLYNEKSGLKKTMIVKNYLIDLYLPFLPLERSQVRKCIMTEAKALSLGVSEEDIDKILDEMVFLPSQERIYSSSGCKGISSLIVRHAHDEL